MVNRLAPPPIKDAIAYQLELKPYSKIILNNGIPVYTIDAGEEDVVQMEWIFDAGNWYENQNLVAASTNHLLKNGTSCKSAFDINEHFEYYGAYLNRHCYNETALISLHSLTKHLGELLPAVREIITDSIFPQEELDIYRQNVKQRLEVNLKKSDFVANRLIDVYLYGAQHPYGKFGTAPEYDMLERAQLVSFYNSYYSNGNCRLFIAGKIPPNLEELLNRSFGDLPLNKNKPADIDHIATPATEKKYRVSNDENGIQGAIRIACNFPNRHSPDFTKAQVLNTVFGGYFGSRLMRNIREDKGYTYGVHSFMQSHIQQSAWVISTEAGTEVCEAAISEVYREMEALRNEPVPADELLLVKNFLIGSILGDLDGPFHIIGRWKNIILNNLPEDHFNRSVQQIKSVTGEELQALANKYLQPEKFYELVVV
ncbi:MAG: insulinase family protein [Chitinophagaceae bacterium]|nr:insulinase family protein [Chitinophagaceae bacterium]MCW5927233.1 insulinase family protein [Chitinophagaceae bacterium]